MDKQSNLRQPTSWIQYKSSSFSYFRLFHISHENHIFIQTTLDNNIFWHQQILRSTGASKFGKQNQHIQRLKKWKCSSMNRYSHHFWLKHWIISFMLTTHFKSVPLFYLSFSPYSLFYQPIDFFYTCYFKAETMYRKKPQ